MARIEDEDRHSASRVPTRRPSSSARRRLACILIGVGVALPVLFGGYELNRYERSSLEATNELNADHAAARFESQLDLRLALLAQLASELGPGPPPDSATFVARAEALLTTFPDFQAVNWVDNSGVIRWVVPEEGNRAALGADLMRHAEAAEAFPKAVESHEPQATGIGPLLQGGRGFATYFPIDGAGGAVNGVFRVRPLLASLIPADLEEKVQLELVDGETEVETDALSERKPIGVLGRSLTLVVAPTAAMTDHRGFSARLLVAFGLLIAVVTGVLVHEMLASRERALEMETHRQALLSAVPDHIVRLGPGFQTLAYHRSPGLVPLPCQLPADRWIPPRLVAKLEQASIEARIVETEVELDGRGFEVRIAPDNEGQVVFFRDVTERQRMESERVLLSKLVESSGQLAAVVGTDGTFAYVNPAGRRMLGLEEDGPSPLKLEQVVEPVGAVLTPLSTGEAWSGQVELRAADGSTLPAHLSSFTVPGSARAPLGILAVDITEITKLHEQLERAQKMEALGTLAAGVAHDFNNALSVFRSGIELLEETEDMPREALEDVALMRSAAGSASHVAAQLLAFARPAAGRSERVAIDTALSATARMLSRTVREEIELAWDLAAGDIEVRCELGALQQAVLNLVLNARDAIEGPGVIEIASRRRLDEEGRQVVDIRVKDTGAGVPPEHVERIFEPFFTTKEAGKGTGLGLAMVRRVVEAQGGRVTLDSEVGRGTEVRLELPEAPPRARPRRSSSTASLNPQRSARVLLVDDEPELRTLLRRAFERAGHEVREAADGIEAISILDQHPMDLMIADVGMPRMGGSELAFRVRREFPTVEVVLMTGHITDDLRQAASVVEVIQKPIDPAMLLDRIESALSART